MMRQSKLTLFAIVGLIFILLSAAPLGMAQPNRPNPFPIPLPSGSANAVPQDLQVRQPLPADHPKAQGMNLQPRLQGEKMQQYLARNPYSYGNRLPPGNFTVNYFGDTNSTDANPGNGICADIDGLCGLRAAIMEANSLDPGSIINIPAGTINLSRVGTLENNSATGDLDIKNSMRIVGAGANATIINANGIDRVFDIYDGTVDLVDIGITGGDVSTITQDAEQDGGGVWINCGVDVLMQRVGIFGNKAVYGSGVILGEFCDTTSVQTAYLYESAVYENTSTQEGAVYTYQNSNLTLRNTTISNNSGTYVAGLFVNTLAANNTLATHITIADNFSTVSDVNGTGLYVGGGNLTLTNSIIAYNGDNDSDNNCGGSAFTSGDNVYTTVGCSSGETDVLDSSLILGVLGDNGGTTPTNALEFNSSAVDLDTDVASCPATDQRGFPRPVGNACDSGAFEVGFNFTNIVVNGSFETDTDSNGVPDIWGVKNLSSDGRKCNTATKIFAFDGLCALRFKGGPGENSQFVQGYGNLSIIEAGDVFKIAAAIRTKNVPVNAGSLVLKGKYVNPSLGNGGKFKTTLSAPSGTTSYTQYSSGSVTIEGEISTLRMQVRYRGTSGQMLVDLVQGLWGVAPARAAAQGANSIQVVGASSVESGVIPLPEASVGSR